MKQSRILITLVAAVWFALTGGLLEAVGYLWFQRQGWLNWSLQANPGNASLLWAAPALDLLLFVIAGTLLWVSLGWFKRLPWEATVTGFFATLAAFGLLVFSDRLRDGGAFILALGLGTVAARWMNRAPGSRMNSLWRSLPIVVALALVVGLGAGPGKSLWERWQLQRLLEPPPHTPNVLLIVLDTVRADRLSCCGYAKPTTPFLESFARQGVRFDNAISNSSWTLPSHASIFTGRYAHEHLAMLTRPLDNRFPTLAEVLARKGYATAAFVANNHAMTESWGLARGFHHWENLFFNWFDAGRRTALGRQLYQYVVRRNPYDQHWDRMQAPEINQRLIDWVESNRGRRFFALANYMEAHEPLLPPFAFAEKFSAEPDAIAPRTPPPGLWGGFRRRRGDGDQKTRRNDAYDAAVSYLDSQLASLFEELKQRKLDENLLVIILADHGQSLGERGYFDHRTSLYKEEILVPLLMRFPGTIPPGLVVSRPVTLRDLPATILAAGQLPAAPFPGSSLLELLQNENAPVSEAVSELEGRPGPGMDPNTPISQGWVRTLITPEWQFILQENGKVELFAWPRDRAQLMNDVANSPERSQLVADFRKKLEALPPLPSGPKENK